MAKSLSTKLDWTHKLFNSFNVLKLAKWTKLSFVEMDTFISQGRLVEGNGMERAKKKISKRLNSSVWLRRAKFFFLKKMSFYWKDQFTHLMELVFHSRSGGITISIHPIITFFSSKYPFIFFLDQNTQTKLRSFHRRYQQHRQGQLTSGKINSLFLISKSQTYRDSHPSSFSTGHCLFFFLLFVSRSSTPSFSPLLFLIWPKIVVILPKTVFFFFFFESICDNLTKTVIFFWSIESTKFSQ